MTRIVCVELTEDQANRVSVYSQELGLTEPQMLLSVFEMYCEYRAGLSQMFQNRFMQLGEDLEDK